MKLSLTVEIDDVIRMLQALGPQVEERVFRDASIPSGRSIANEARGRVARRTGRTAAAITSAEDDSTKTVHVFVGRTSRPAQLPTWLEFGTIKMTARPFLFVSAELEEPSHRRRLEDAVNAAIDEVGG